MSDGSHNREIGWLATRLGELFNVSARLSGRDRQQLKLTDTVDAAKLGRAVQGLIRKLDLVERRWRSELTTETIPAIMLTEELELSLIYGRTPAGTWMSENSTGRRDLDCLPASASFLPVGARLAAGARLVTAREMFGQIMSQEKGWLPLAVLASTISAALLLATSLYSMQVYDRVIGQNGLATLIVLTIGTGSAILIEFALKLARSAIIDRAIKSIDYSAAVSVFERMLSIRLDQLPPSFGTLAAQVRGFDTVRSYLVARSIYFTTDAPLAVFFLLLIWWIGGSMMVVAPAIALVIAVLSGLSFRRAIQRHATQENLVGNRRQGLLVEAMQGAEFIKSAGAEWLIQTRWNGLSREGAEEAAEIKRLNENAAHFSATINQLGYIALVAIGAWLAVADRSLTVGTIIACSILSSRVLAPVAALPGLLVQWAHARVALDSLEKLFALECDNHGQEAPITPATLQGRIEIRGLEFSWPGQTTIFAIKSLTIAPGERVGILGPVGAGKTTLLKLLAGLIQPTSGHVLHDGIAVQQIAAHRRTELIGYLPQATRMIGGSLRDNLTLGLSHVSEEQILDALQATGLITHVMTRPEGLDMPVAEGGEGFSRGQRQLAALTRMLLARPALWMLDEPTASLDDAAESRCLTALRATIANNQTLVLVTHKPRLLELVDRLIVVTPSGILADGSKDAIIELLRQQAQQSREGKAGTDS